MANTSKKAASPKGKSEPKEAPAARLVPPPKESFTVPPFDELTLIIFGPPGSGKTKFCASCPGSLFVATEPGQEFTKTSVVDVPNWETFKALVNEIAGYRKQIHAGTMKPEDFPYHNFVIDIVDNLNASCRDYICKNKGLKYPPSSDFGRTWSEITAEWKGWLGALMRLGNVRFITHCTEVEKEVTLDDGMKAEVQRSVPTFRGSKAAQYLDGIVNAMGYTTQNQKGEYVITFAQSAKVGAKDRTDILTQLGELPLNWQAVSKAYAAKAKEMDLKVKSKRG